MSKLDPLEDVLQNKLVRVADYQRPYAWQPKQLRDLWDDLDLLGSDRHYAGTLVLQRTDEVLQTQAGKNLTVYEVVDGQQRLTTCVILLEQIRRRLSGLADRTLPGVQEALDDLARLLHVNLPGGARPRLGLGEQLQHFFAESILGERVSDKPDLVAGEQRLSEAVAFFSSRIDALVSGVDEPEAARRLVELRARVCFGLQFLVYDVQRNAEVGVLFETLNDRGKDLTELEKAKNYLLYLSRQIPEARQKELARLINYAWAEIFTNLAQANEHDDDALLRAHWIAAQDHQGRGWEGTASIKARFPRAKYVPTAGRLAGTESAEAVESGDLQDELVADITDYVQTLRQCSAFYRDLYIDGAPYREFDRTVAEQVRSATAALVRSDTVANFRPLLFAARLRHSSDGDLYLKLVRLSETFAARVYAICSLRSTAGQSVLYSAARALYRGADPARVVDDVTAKLWNLAPDSAVRAGFGPAVEWYHRRSHKYVLYEFEMQLVRAGNEHVPFKHFSGTGARTTEHVLPQHTAENSQWRKDFTGEERDRLTHSIGNLVLTFDNSRYSNHDYARKRGVPGQDDPRCYFSTGALARERQLAQTYEQWTPESVEHRRRTIEDWALQRWQVTPPVGVSPSVEDD